ncbi:Cytochrome P450 [Dillenia turbinata]|uniref:Cytochrome P450 n=1 Tax=Dillenia turbinata TaxID=194707 RepID=A0AAN8V5M1_9MAGN
MIKVVMDALDSRNAPTIFIIFCILFLYFLLNLLKFLNKVWWTPLRIQHLMSLQGIKGPPYKFLFGNTPEILKMRTSSMQSPMELSHDIFPRICPHVPAWTKLYGENFLYWHGPQPKLVITEPELIREIFSGKEKPKSDSYEKKLIGDGILRANGEKWSKKRKLAVPSFNGDHLKGMIGAMIVSVKMMLDRWREHEGREIEVYEEFRVLTSEVISRTAFGSSYLDGKNIFETLTQLGIILSRNRYTIQFPVIGKLFKSKDDVTAEKLDQDIRCSILEIIKSREKKLMAGELDKYGSDFLGSLMKAYHETDETKRITEDDVIDECKIFYLAGHETTTSFLSWTMLLLAMYPDWQEKVRKEVLELFGEQDPTAEGIARLNIMSMIINESLRLYTPIVSIPRRVKRGTTVKNITFPADMDIIVQPLSVHSNPQVWGEDAHLFKPERLAEGIAKATGNNTAAFLAFGWGPRTCVGLSFAVNEAKIALSMIMQRYTFTLSPTYVHYPVQVLTILPELGVQIVNVNGQEEDNNLGLNSSPLHLCILATDCGKLLMSPDDVESEKLEKEVKDSILRIIRDREKKAMTGEADSFGSDFVGLLRRANHDLDKREGY